MSYVLQKQSGQLISVLSFFAEVKCRILLALLENSGNTLPYFYYLKQCGQDHKGLKIENQCLLPLGEVNGAVTPAFSKVLERFSSLYLSILIRTQKLKLILDYKYI